MQLSQQIPHPEPATVTCLNVTRQRTGRSGVRVPAGAGNFSLHHRIQTGSGAYPASYPVGTGGSFPEGKTARGVELTTHFHLVPRSRMRGAIPPHSHTSSWRGAKLRHRDNFTFIRFQYSGDGRNKEHKTDTSIKRAGHLRKGGRRNFRHVVYMKYTSDHSRYV
jgi:hypothetical protein